MKPMQTTTPPKAAQREIEEARNIAGVVAELWERTASKLTPAELEWFAGVGEIAVLNLHHLEDVIDSIGCMVSSDHEGKGGSPTGCFQSHQDTPSLLFFVADAIRQARALVAVSDDANYRLRKPDLYRAQ